jgi:hypothetical protein
MCPWCVGALLLLMRGRATVRDLSRALCGVCLSSAQAGIKDVATGRWEVAGDVVIMPLNAENQHQPKVFTETIKYSDVARVLLRR